MAETYIGTGNLNSVPYVPSLWDRYGFGDRSDLSLRRIPDRAMQVVKGDALAAPLQIMTSPIRAGARIWKGKTLDGVGVRPTEVFDSPENVALTALAVAGPVARVLGGAWQGVRGVTEFARYAKSAKGIRDARRVYRAIASGATEVPQGAYVGKALHWAGSPVRWLAENLFKVPVATSSGGQVAADLAYTVATEEVARRGYKAYIQEGQNMNKEEAEKTAPEKADPTAAKDFVDSRTNSTPEQVSTSLRQGSEDWILADAQARLLAASGPTNETALAEFNGRVKPLRDREFRRLYGEMTGTDPHQFDFENDTLRESPDMENANAVRERHRAAARRFMELTPDQWRTASWIPEGGN